MADTSRIKKVIEPYIQGWLSTKFPGHTFRERRVMLRTGHTYSFDAASEDGSIVAAILCNRAKTRTGRENIGGVRKALAELAYLKQTSEATQRAMVFTDTGFSELIRRRANRAGMGNIHIVVCTLPPNLGSLLREILDEASYEQHAAE